MTTFKEPYDAAIKAINQAGSPFEIGRTTIDQTSYLTYLNAPKNIPELLAPGRTISGQERDQDFLIYQDERLSFEDFFNQADALSDRSFVFWELCVIGEEIDIALGFNITHEPA